MIAIKNLLLFIFASVVIYTQLKDTPSESVTDTNQIDINHYQPINYNNIFQAAHCQQDN